MAIPLNDIALIDPDELDTLRNKARAMDALVALVRNETASLFFSGETAHCDAGGWYEGDTLPAAILAAHAGAVAAGELPLLGGGRGDMLAADLDPAAADAYLAALNDALTRAEKAEAALPDPLLLIRVARFLVPGHTRTDLEAAAVRIRALKGE